ncbi:CysB family HTH-type transcriptional regulator [Parvibium lacunae]|uniref:CysB family HTH-type transcriptional regulator n=1 Tax=Parvibium lacunae TaxID=1888893 RepID=A0A368KYF2_9BURK|nr:CysB family HTH-type transcriptional regulator [Parvibium lacunae]RCS56473.1 CysB family HTH-type transcriptional regulator [Parvibium lacunae]
MNLHQLKFVREAVRQKFSLTAAAEALHTSQPGVSKAIIELEQELGVEIFQRHGKRIKDLTEPGREIYQSVERVMQEIDNLKRIGKEYAARSSGDLRIAITHTQARYALPRVVPTFKQRYPDVHLSLLQGTPSQIATMVIQGEADLAIATEAIADYKELVALPCYTWEHVVIVPKGHDLEREIKKGKPLTIELVARYPIITYDSAFAGRQKIDEAFARKQIVPDLVLAAVDADVIKTYVELGLGIGIIANMAYDAKRDSAFSCVTAGHLFGTHTTKLALKPGVFLRSYVYTFVEIFAPSLNRKLIDKALSGNPNDYDL